MRALVLGLGSAGDVNPMLGLSPRLAHPGAHGRFRRQWCLSIPCRAPGLEFLELGTEQDYREALNDPDLWHPTKAYGVVARRLIVPALRPLYRMISEWYVPGESVIAAPATAFAARIANEKPGVPLATVHLQPALIRSCYQSPAVGLRDMFGRLPRFVKSILFRIVDRLFLDKPVLKEQSIPQGIGIATDKPPV